MSQRKFKIILLPVLILSLSSLLFLVRAQDADGVAQVTEDNSVAAAAAGSCSAHGENAQECKKSNCEFNLVTKQCVDKILPCTESIFGDNFEKCRRAGAHYSSAGVLCKNEADSENGTCDGSSTLSLNLGGKDYIYRFRQFAEELQNDFTDEGDSRNPKEFDQQCENEVKDDHFKKFYSSGIVGEPKGGKGCVKYEVGVEKDGVYELSIFGMEPTYKESGKRCFDVMLNSLTVLYGVDHYAISGQTCAQNEIVILFRVEEEGTKLIPLGFPEGIEVEGSVELGFCFGTCGFEDNSYLVSAFSVFRYGESDFKPNPSDPCSVHDGRACACKKTGTCEYHTPYQLCLTTPTECHEAPSGCMRADTWYIDGGVMCKITEQAGNCTLERNIMGVNLAGPGHISNINVTYLAYADVPRVRTPAGVTEGNEPQAKVPDGNAADLTLYQTFVTGKKELKDAEDDDYDVADLADCLRYDVPISKPGFYELIIKFGDFKSTGVTQRTVNFKFNGVNIVQELDMFKYTGSQYGVADMILDFYVNLDGIALHMPGHGRSVVKNGLVPLEFCHGGCSADMIPSAEWIVSSWAVIQLPDRTTAHSARK